MADTNLNPRAMLKAEALVSPVQQVFNEELIVARDVPKDTVDAQTITYWKERHSQGEEEFRTPLDWDLEVEEWPEIQIQELDRENAKLGGLAAKVRFGAQRLEFSTGTARDLADAVDQMFRGFAQEFETRAFDAYTNQRETANGGEFSSEVSSFTDDAGYATNGGHVVFNVSNGEEWNNGGDAIDQLSDIKNVMEEQGRIANLDGTVDTRGPWRMYVDGLVWKDLHKQLRLQGIQPDEGVAPESITVTGLYGIEFVRANFAIGTDGDALLVDMGNDPVIGYYHVYDRLADVGFRTIRGSGAESPGQGFPLQVRDTDEDNGSATVQAASATVFVNRKPKYIALITGLHN